MICVHKFSPIRGILSQILVDAAVGNFGEGDRNDDSTRGCHGQRFALDIEGCRIGLAIIILIIEFVDLDAPSDVATLKY